MEFLPLVPLQSPGGYLPGIRDARYVLFGSRTIPAMTISPNATEARTVIRLAAELMIPSERTWLRFPNRATDCEL
jgi:hypothetical protein